MKPNDIQAINLEISAFTDAWNQGDARAIASFFTEDCHRVGAMGDTQHGRAELEIAFEKLFNASMPGAIVKLEKGTVRMLTADYAVWQGGMEIFPSPGAPPLRGHVVEIMQKVKDRWLVLEAHPKFFPPTSKP